MRKNSKLEIVEHRYIFETKDLVVPAVKTAKSLGIKLGGLNPNCFFGKFYHICNFLNGTFKFYQKFEDSTRDYHISHKKVFLIEC